MENCNIADLMHMKQLLEKRVANLEARHKELIACAAKEMLIQGSHQDILQEQRLGQNYEEHTLAAANAIAKNNNGFSESNKKLQPTVKCVEQLNNESAWKIDSTSSHPVHSETKNISIEQGLITRRHSVRWKHGDELTTESMTFWAVAKYVTCEWKGIVKNVSDVKIEIEMPEELDKYYETNEIQLLIDYCTENNNLPLFFGKSTELFSHWMKRHQILEKFNLEKEFEYSEESCTVFTVKLVDRKKREIASIFWSIGFNVKTCSIQENIISHFSKIGKKLAKDYNFPDEVIKTGKYDAWTPENYIDNICRMIHHENSNERPGLCED